VLDAIALEKRGIPAVPIGVQQLVMTTGRGMARIQGVPDFPIAVLTHAMGALESIDDPKVIEGLANQAMPQVETILLGRH
jgi:hypothetical protein